MNVRMSSLSGWLQDDGTVHLPTPPIKRWKIIQQIGEGSFGIVYEAQNLDDESFFAVKVSRDESKATEIQKEVDILSQLRHSNVVQYLGTGKDENGHLCIFLELMQYSLHSTVGHLDETEIRMYTQQILQGLEYLHRNNTIHRDIKSANILVDRRGQVKLADFGVAKEVGISLATSFKGTPYFMAPEILKPSLFIKPGYGPPVDIWSLGCTVFEMADGKPPWSFLEGLAFYFKVIRGELPPIPQHLSQSCQDFIRRCLQFRPEDRPTASELLEDLFVANAPARAAVRAFVSPSPSAYNLGLKVERGSGAVDAKIMSGEEIMGFKGRIVEEASARYDVSDYYIADANHFDVEINPRTMEIDQPTEGIKQLNNSIYELYTPQSVPRVQVIFFHGLPQEDDYKEAYWKTWKSRDGTVIWPKEWLPDQLPSPQILSVSYDSYARRHDGAIDSYSIAENLIQDIILGRARLGQDCPVVLVGHCLGGIIIKLFLLACLAATGGPLRDIGGPKMQLIERFLENCKGVFCYSTPHCGSDLFDYLGKEQVPMNAPLMKLLKILSSEIARTNCEFARSRLGKDIRTKAIGETLDTTYMGFKGRIVAEASARYGIDPFGFYTASHANHFEVCRAADNKSCIIFIILLHFIKTAIKDKGPGLVQNFLS